MNIQERNNLLAEKASLEHMLEELPESSVIDRMSLEARKVDVEKTLANEQKRITRRLIIKDNKTYPSWEYIANNTYRLKISGGYLYRYKMISFRDNSKIVTETVLFVPDVVTESETLKRKNPLKEE